MISQNSLEVLEFNRLLGIIADLANSDASRASVLAISPLNNKDDMERRLSQIGEIRRMSQKGEALHISKFSDIAPLLAKARPKGAVLDAIELSGVMTFLSVASTVLTQIREREDLLFLNELADGMTGHPDLLRILKRTVDSEGNILDSASSALSGLRAQVKRLEARIQKKLEEMARDERVAVFLQDDFITQRYGRWVIPVRMDSKGQVPGIVHDISRSGETAFVEPLAVISLSNELENASAEVKAEEIRILRELSFRIRTVVDEIEADYDTVVYIDALNCIARFADQLRMENPQINEQGLIHVVSGRHPLLLYAYKKKGEARQVVPLDVRLGRDSRVMVITGANAGGKTISIKTIGLLVLMALSGMPVPADSSSSFPLVRKLLVDIGDKQSIEDSLSTFSAHVSNIAGILKVAGQETLVLIDELGTGTDPEEGGAIACAVLKELKDSGALIFATTHLADIKGFVYKTEGMLSASMEFDQGTFTPLYKLRVGEPGQSYALETAKRYGLPDSIIGLAKEMLGGRKIELDALMSDLSEKRAGYERALGELSGQQAELAEKERLFAARLSESEIKQKELLANAYKEASDIVLDTKRQMHALFDELKKKGRESAREAIRQAEAMQESFAAKIKEYDKGDTPGPAIEEIREGDTVFIKSLGHDAVVTKVNLKGRSIKARMGSMEVEVPAAEIGFRKGSGRDISEGAMQVAEADEEVSSRINFVGLRVDEVLSRLESFLNHAALAGFSEVTIIHGIGAGILAKAVREHLTGHPLVNKFRSGVRDEGGAGVTIATLN